MKLGVLKLTVNPRHLAHCKMCREPMFCIYDWTLRHYCWECKVEMGLEDDHRQAVGADRGI